MGAALADEAARRGAERARARRERERASGPRRRSSTSRPRPSSSARRCAQAATADVVLMAAAVADYRPGRARSAASAPARAPGRSSSSRRTTSSRRSARRAGPGQVLVGFAAETGADGVERARGKLVRKGLDLVVLNDVSRADIGFDSRRQRGRARLRATVEELRAEGGQARRSRRASSIASRPCSRTRRAPAGVPFGWMEASRLPDEHRDAAVAGSRGRRRARLGRARRAQHARARRRGARRRGPRADRGRARRRQDARGARARPRGRLLVLAAAVHARPAALRRHRHERLRPAHRRRSRSGPARCSRTSCWSTRSTAPRRGRRPRCSSAWRRARSRSTARRTRCARPFMVLATQNPVEHEGTFPLPEAQLDRFLPARLARLSAGRRGGAHARRADGRRAGSRSTRSSRSAARPSWSRPLRPPAGCTSRSRCTATWSRCCTTRAPTSASRSAPARARASRCVRACEVARAAARPRRSRPPTTCAPSRRPVLVHRLLPEPAPAST